MCLSALYSPIIFLKTYIAKKSGSVQLGASKKTPILRLDNSSSLIYIVDGVWYGLSLFLLYPKVALADPKEPLTAVTNLVWSTLPVAATIKFGPTTFSATYFLMWS